MCTGGLLSRWSLKFYTAPAAASRYLAFTLPRRDPQWYLKHSVLFQTLLFFKKKRFDIHIAGNRSGNRHSIAAKNHNPSSARMAGPGRGGREQRPPRATSHLPPAHTAGGAAGLSLALACPAAGHHSRPSPRSTGTSAAPSAGASSLARCWLLLPGWYKSGFTLPQAVE